MSNVTNAGSRDSERRCARKVWGVCTRAGECICAPSPLPAEGETERLVRTEVARACEAVERSTGDDATVSATQAVLLLVGERIIAALPASAAAGEVRVEWGVRYVGSLFDERYELWFDNEQDRNEIATHRSREGYGVQTTTRTETRTVTTSPWVPVSDDQSR